MCCLICFHLKVDFSVQWCTAREQVCCDFMLFHWWSRALSGKHQSKNLQEVTGRTSSPAWNLWNLLYIAPLRRLLSGILQFKIWTMISLLYSGPRYGSVQFMFSKGKLCKLSRTFKMFNRQFIQFARIPVEFVARLSDMSTQKYNNFSIDAVILE